jgi:hypothetical protein
MRGSFLTMKTTLVAIMLLLGGSPAGAQFAGGDSFSGPAKDPAKWGDDVASGSGTLTQTGGVLRYTSLGASDDDYMAWPWLESAPFDSSWSVQVDVHVPYIALADGHTAAGMGLLVRNPADATDSFDVALENFRNPGESQKYHFLCGADVDDDGPEIFVDTSSRTAAVRISWNAATGTLTGEYDADGPVNGYSWTAIHSFRPGVEGWGMSSGDSFQILVGGYSETTAVAAARNLHADNFVITEQAASNLAGGDNFDDNLRNETRWGEDETEGGGQFNEVNSRLEFTSGDAMGGSALRPWAFNTGSAVEAWEVVLDVSLGTLNSPMDGDGVGIGLQVGHGAFNAALWLETGNVGGSQARRFRWQDEAPMGASGNFVTTTQTGSIRISYDPAAQALRFHHDENGPTGGHVWTELGSLDLGASGANWGLDGDSRFDIAVVGEALGVVVASGDAFAENFEAGSVQPSGLTGIPSGQDDFSGASKNTLIWGKDMKRGSGQLTQTDGVLRFTSAGTAEDDVMAWPWLVAAPFGSSWTVQADVHVPWIPLANGHTAAGMGVLVLNSADPLDTFAATLENFRNPGEPQRFHFLGNSDVDDDGTEVYSPAPSSNGAVRVAWDAASGTLSAAFDPDGPLNGYSWTVIKTFRPGTDGWGMKSSGKFNVFLAGYSEWTQVTAAHDVHADNFRVFGILGTPLPPLVKALPAEVTSHEAATLHGSVDAKGFPRDVFFDYGTTTAFGSTVVAVPDEISGTGAKPVSVLLSGLAPHTKYHYRVRAASVQGGAGSAALSFTTANRLPATEDDSFKALPESTVVLDVLDNDDDPDGDILTITSVKPLTPGLKFKNNGSHVVLTTPASFTQPVTFFYNIKDGFGGVTEVTATVEPTTLMLDLNGKDDLVSEGGSYDVEVSSDGLWSVQVPSWIRAEPSTGAGDGTVTLTVLPNTSLKSRTAVVKIGGRQHTVEQAGVLKPSISDPAMIDPAIVSGYYQLLIPVVNLPVTFSVKNLPPGLTINGSTGLISGKPLKGGRTYTVQISAKNAAGAADDVLEFDIPVAELEPGIAGVFHGLVSPHPLINNNLGSRLELTVAGTGAVTGKIITGTSTQTFTTSLNSDVNSPDNPACVVPLSAKNRPAQTLNLAFSGSGNSAAGEVVQGGEQATATVWRNPWTKDVKASDFKGLHTFSLLQPDADPVLPQGHGYGSFTVAEANGGLNVGGRLADGSTFTTGTFVSEAGDVLVYQSLYSGGGSLAGSLRVATGAEPADNVVSGNLEWFKPGQGVTSKDTVYHDGIGPVTLNVDGGGYGPLEAGDIILGSGTGPDNALLEFRAGGLDDEAMEFDVAVSIANPSLTGTTNTATVSKNPAANPQLVKITKFDVKTGAVAGEFTLQTAPPRKTTWQAQLTRSSGIMEARGFFLMPTSSLTNAPRLSGRVVLKEGP